MGFSLPHITFPPTPHLCHPVLSRFVNLSSHLVSSPCLVTLPCLATSNPLTPHPITSLHLPHLPSPARRTQCLVSTDAAAMGLDIARTRLVVICGPPSTSWKFLQQVHV